MNDLSWLAALILALAAWRVWHLLAEDLILEPVRRYVTRLPDDWEEGDKIPSSYRENVAEFINCPFCLGFWVALGWVGAYALWPDATLWVAAPFALNAAAIGAGRILSE